MRSLSLAITASPIGVYASKVARKCKSVHSAARISTNIFPDQARPGSQASGSGQSGINDPMRIEGDYAGRRLCGDQGPDPSGGRFEPLQPAEDRPCGRWEILREFCPAATPLNSSDRRHFRSLLPAADNVPVGTDADNRRAHRGGRPAQLRLFSDLSEGRYLPGPFGPPVMRAQRVAHARLQR